MAITLLANNRATRDAKVPPITINDQGEPVKWRMFYDDNRRVADGDSLAEFVNVLIPGYLEKDNAGERQLARLVYLKSVQDALRVLIYANLTAEEEEALTEEERYLLLDRNASNINFDVSSEGANDDDGIFIWKQPHPLVLIDLYYPPFNDTTVKPISSEGDYENVSNILWLRAENDYKFLTSLSAAGHIAFGHPRAEYRVPPAIRRREAEVSNEGTPAGA